MHRRCTLLACSVGARSLTRSLTTFTPRLSRFTGARARADVLAQADGSAYLEQGNTKVIAAVYGPREVVHASRSSDESALINCEFSMATFSTGERKKGSKGDRKSNEMSLLIQDTFAAIVETHLFPRSQIDIYIQVLQADGGVRAAAINAATLALINAGIPMRDFVVACAAGFLDGSPLLDLNFAEEGAGGANMPLAILPSTGAVAMMQLDSRVSASDFARLMELATRGCRAVHDILMNEVKEHTLNLFCSRS